MEEEIFSKILDLQSPFRWIPVIRDENRHEFDLEYEEDGSFSFLNFCSRIVLLYDGFMNKGKALGSQLLAELDEQLQRLEKSNCQNELYVKCKDAIYHVFLACKSQMAILDGKHVEDVTQWINEIKKFDEMDTTNKAAIYAMKACAHSLFTNDGLDSSIGQMNMAIACDKSTPYFKFLKGYILWKHRPSNEVPKLQEREAFDEAYKSDTSNPLFMVYVADSVRETCKYRPKTYLWFVAKSAEINAGDAVDEKYNTALALYRKSYELRPNCPVIAFKCANGLMRLPLKYQDVKLIKKIISEGEKQFPNSGFGNMVCAMYHQQINKKTALSRRCLEKCVELNFFNGCMNLIRLDFGEKKEAANVVERLEKMLNVFGEAARQEIIISQIISYYVFVDGNIEKACEYMLKYYRTKSNGRYLEKHQSIFKVTEGPISLVDVITDQVKIKLKDRQLPKEKRTFYNDFVRQMSFHNVEVLKGNPKNLLEQINKSAVPKGKNPSKSNESQRSSSQHTRQPNDRAGYASRSGDDRKREDAPRDRKGAGRGAAGENVPGKNASPRRRDDRNPDRRDYRPDKRLGQKPYENDQKNDASPRRPDDRRLDRRADNRSDTFNKRPGGELGDGRASKNDAGAKKIENRRPEEASASGAKKKENRRPEEASANLPATSSGKHSTVVKSETTNAELQMLMDMCSQGESVDLNAVFAKWKSLSLKDNATGKSEIPHTVPESYDRQQGKMVSSEGRSRRSEDRSSDRRRERSRSEASGRSHRHKERHRKPKVKESEDVATSKERRHSEERHRDRSASEASDRSRRHKHRHRKHKKHHRSSDSEDERRDRRFASPSRRHRRRSEDRADRKSHRKHRSSESASDLESAGRHRKSHRKHRNGSASDLEGSVVRQRKSHRKHRNESASDSERSVRRSKKSHRKHRHSESVSGSDRSVDRHRDKEKRSHHRSKKHSSERHEKRRSHRDHEKSEKSRRKKESKKGNSDSESGDTR